jgi:phosphomannomutase
MIACTGKRISELLQTVYGLTGRLYVVEENLPATSEMRIVIPRRLAETEITHVGPYPVLRTSHMDGTKLYLENGNWLLLRFSGTEPVLRIFAEADSPEKASELVQWIKNFVALEGAQ